MDEREASWHGTKEMVFAAFRIWNSRLSIMFDVLVDVISLFCRKFSVLFRWWKLMVFKIRFIDFSFSITAQQHSSTLINMEADFRISICTISNGLCIELNPKVNIEPISTLNRAFKQSNRRFISFGTILSPITHRHKTVCLFLFHLRKKPWVFRLSSSKLRNGDFGVNQKHDKSSN